MIQYYYKKMLQTLPWEIQKHILQFGAKEDLHNELKEKLKVYEQLKEEIHQSRFRNFLRDWQPPLDVPSDEKTNWNNWALKTILNGGDSSLSFAHCVYVIAFAP